MDKLKAAIIGCGAICNNHGNSIEEILTGELVCVVDKVESKAKETAEKFGCKYEVDYKKMLKNNEIQVVHIATPHFLHVPMIMDIVKAGKDVVVEKPVALNHQQSKTLIENLKDFPERKVIVCYQNRYNPTSIKAKEIIEERIYGDLIGIKGLVTWYRDKEYYTNSDWRGSFETEGGGVLINQAIHTLDLMQWFGGKIDKIKGHVDTRILEDVIEVEDTADATIKFSNGAIGVFYATNCNTTNSSVEIELNFEKGTLVIKDGSITLHKDGEIQILLSESVASGQKNYWGMSHKVLIDQYYRDLIDDKQPEISPYNASISLEMINGIYESNKNNKYYKMKY